MTSIQPRPSKKRVLLSAFACDPYFGSDEEVGWQWARELTLRGFEVTVLTRRTHQAEIERGIAATGQCQTVHFEYVDIEWLYPLLSLVNRRNHLYYYFWQVAAFLRARNLQRVQAFDYIHHVTWVSFRQPSFMGWVGAPFLFGPVAGGDEIPAGYTQSFSFKQRLVERARILLNSCVRFDPLMHLTFRQASKVLFTSEAHLRRVPAFVRDKASVELAIAMPPDVVRTECLRVISGHSGPRLLFVGRCIAWKGLDIGLQIFVQVQRACPTATLTIIGEGSDKARWMSLAQTLGIAHALEWRGWMSKDEVQQQYAEFDLLFYPSLRDSGGFVVLEALQHGLPVVCFKLGGPGVMVDDTCGKAVPAHADIPLTIQRYAEAVLAVLAQLRHERGAVALAAACRQRASVFSWARLIDRVYGPS